MFATMTALIVLAFIATSTSRGVDIGLVAPLLVDLVAWYVIGAYLGVFPTL